MNFCSHCGSSAIEYKIPGGDNRPRYCCPDCATIFYENPKIVAGCIGQWQDRILMCKRAIEPRSGAWTLPAGFMENHETIQEAAARETFEEATARAVNLQLFAVYNLPHISQVYVMFRGDIEEGRAASGSESLATAFMDEPNIPWPKLAFPVITEILRLYFADRRRNKFCLHSGEIRRLADRSIKTTRY